MSSLRVDYWKLIDYKEYLIKQSDILKNRLLVLRNLFLALDWSDNVMQAMQKVLNAHILTVNNLLQKLECSISNLDKFIEYVNRYLDSV